MCPAGLKRRLGLQRRCLGAPLSLADHFWVNFLNSERLDVTGRIFNGLAEADLLAFLGLEGSAGELPHRPGT